jgi:hypothetical protein
MSNPKLQEACSSKSKQRTYRCQDEPTTMVSHGRTEVHSRGWLCGGLPPRGSQLPSEGNSSREGCCADLLGTPAKLSSMMIWVIAVQFCEVVGCNVAAVG